MHTRYEAMPKGFPLDESDLAQPREDPKISYDQYIVKISQNEVPESVPHKEPYTLAMPISVFIDV